MAEIVRIGSYVEDRWVDGEGTGSRLVDPTTGETVATASTEGIDLGTALRHAREVGGASLRGLTFVERGAILKDLSRIVREHRDELLDLARRNGGNTPSDGSFDLDGASGTFFFYANLARSLGERTVLADGEPVRMGKESPFGGRHAWVSRRGVAVCINAFNFPAWGMAEKMACALLAGMPVLVKPATATALVAYRLGQLFVESGRLPAGSWSFLGGGAGDLLDHLETQDVLAFTGSADTGRRLRTHPRVLDKGVRVNVEADSLNAAVLGPDVEPDSDTWKMFVRETAREMTQKAGQKCTATRRIVVPRERLDAAQDALIARLERVRIGDPGEEGIGLGPVSSRAQLDEVNAGVEALAGEARVVYTGPAGDPRGFFAPVRLLRVEDPRAARTIHEREVFGPVATLMPYEGPAEAVELVGRGGGSLVSSVYSDDESFLREAVLGAAAWNGRVYIGSSAVAREAWGPGAVPPGLIHGGPGRAGAGEELGGLRGVHHFMHRVALEGSLDLIDRIVEPGEA